MNATLFDRHGILLRRDAIARGFDDNALARMVRSGAITRMRHGAYVNSEIWQVATRVERHNLVSRAVMRQYDDRVALSHASNVVRRGGPDWGLDLSTVHITNLYGRGDRTQAGITHHRGACHVNDVTRLDGHWATSPARAAIETAAMCERDPAVAVLDWFLNQKLATIEQYLELVELLMREWAGTVDLGARVGLCDGRRASVGESRTGLFLGDRGFAAEPQWQVPRPDGRLAGIVDFALHAEKVMIEFDGWIKYGRLLRPGQTLADVIMAERAREKLLEELTGYWMFRVIWDDLENPDATDRRLRRVVARSAARRAS